MSKKIDEIIESTPTDRRNFYQKYSIEEETARVAYHYEVEPEFFLTLTGGEWNTYSCSIWEDGFAMTQAQEKKLDKFAKMMRLKPGQHILDVGFGWGGPLVYLCHKYGVTGHGITVSPMGAPTARERAAKYGVDATFEVMHWQDLPETETYDAIFSDEVVVHINDLSGFFAKCHKILKPQGIMVHKELHLTHFKHKNWSSDPLEQHVNKVFGYTGNYRPLYQELELLDQNNFLLRELFEIPLKNYQQTIADNWITNMRNNRKRLSEIVPSEYFRNIRIYLKGALLAFKSGFYGLHIVASQRD
jgi:cyclopropane-fatty-acyl-phospholipid synthase